MTTPAWLVNVVILLVLVFIIVTRFTGGVSEKKIWDHNDWKFVGKANPGYSLWESKDKKRRALVHDKDGDIVVITDAETGDVLWSAHPIEIDKEGWLAGGQGRKDE